MTFVHIRKPPALYNDFRELDALHSAKHCKPVTGCRVPDGCRMQINNYYIISISGSTTFLLSLGLMKYKEVFDQIWWSSQLYHATLSLLVLDSSLEFVRVSNKRNV